MSEFIALGTTAHNNRYTMGMTPGIEDSDPPEGVPTIEDFPSTSKSLEKLFRGVCDIRRTGAYETDEEEDVSYDLYLQEGSSSPVTDSLISQHDANANATVLKVTPLPPPPPILEVASPSPSPYEDRADTPRRILFPKYNDGKATEGDSPSSEVTAKIENSIKTPPAGNTTSSKRTVSINEKPPRTSWLRRLLMFVVINAFVVGAAVQYFKTPSGGKVFNQISNNILNEESEVRQYVSNMEKKVKEAIGEENIAMIDGKRVEFLATLSEYYNLHLEENIAMIDGKRVEILATLREYYSLHLEESIAMIDGKRVEILATLSEYYSLHLEETVAIIDGKRVEFLATLSEYYSLHFDATADALTSVVGEDEIPDRSETPLEVEDEDSESEESDYTEESPEIDETVTKSSEEDSLSDVEDPPIEELDEDTTESSKDVPEEELEQLDLNEDEEVLASEKDIEIETETDDPVLEETENDASDYNDDGDDNEEEEEKEQERISDDLDGGLDSKDDEEEDITDEEISEEVLEDPNLVDDEESTGVEADSETFVQDDSVLEEEEKDLEDLPMGDDNVDVDTGSIDESTSEDVVGDVDNEEPSEEEYVEHIENEADNPDLDENHDISASAESSDFTQVEENLEDEVLDEVEEAPVEEIHEESLVDANTAIDVSAEEQLEVVDLNESEETILTPEVDADEKPAHESDSIETTEDLAIFETKEEEYVGEEEEEESEELNDELSVSETLVDESEQFSESDGDEIDLQVNTGDESSISSQDVNLVDETVLEDNTGEKDGEAEFEVGSEVVEDGVRDEDFIFEPIETMPSDIPTMILKIQEITKRDGSSTPSPSTPSDISDMIKGIEGMLKDANIERVYHQEEEVDLLELKARKKWNTPLGWMTRRQRS